MGILSGAATGAAIGSAIPGIGTAIGAIGGGVLGLFGAAKNDWDSKKAMQLQNKHQKEMLGLQYQYNEKAAENNLDRAEELWNKTGYAAQVKQLEAAGLNKALMYQNGGGMASSTSSSGNSGVGLAQANAVQLALQSKAMSVELKNKEADTILKLAQAYKEKGEADKKGAELENLTAQNEILKTEKELKEQQKEINANTITEGAALSQKAVTELNIAMDNADISRKTKEGRIEEFFVNLSNMKAEGALTLAKKDLTEKQREYVEEQIKYYYFDLMTGRISAAAAEKQAENTAQKIKNEFEQNGIKLDIEKERLLKEWIYGGASAISQIGETALEFIPTKKIIKTIVGGRTKTTFER